MLRTRSVKNELLHILQSSTSLHSRLRLREAIITNNHFFQFITIDLHRMNILEHIVFKYNGSQIRIVID